MSLILAESWDSPNPKQKWTDWSVSGALPAGRNGLGFVPGANSPSTIEWVLASADRDDLMVVGAAVKFSSLANDIFLLGTLNTGGGGLNHTLRIGANANGSIRVERYDGSTGTTLGTTAAGMLTTGTWYYIELKVRMHASTGTVEVRTNGVTRLTLTSQNTAPSGEVTCYYVKLRSQAHTFDDVYILNEQGSSFTDFLGDIVIEATKPNGAGNSAQMTAFGGAASDQAALTDASDTTGLEETTDTEKTTLAHSNLTNTTLPVLGVQVWARAKIEVAPAAMNLIARSGATETDSAEITLTSSYAWYQATFATKPGGGAWSASDVDAAEFGIKAQV